MTKNITLAIDEDLLDKARVLAAMKRTSVNEMVRAFLAREVEAETQGAARMDVWTNLFQRADGQKQRRRQRIEAGGAENRIFDREEFYEEVMRERGLL
jgi:hypothetical protein